VEWLKHYSSLTFVLTYEPVMLTRPFMNIAVIAV
jgi:hypothetical protein